MSTNFENIIADDARAVFSGADNFGETIIYKDENAVESTFTANVFRDPPQPIAGAGMPDSRAKIVPGLKVFIPYDPTGVNGRADVPDRGGVHSIYTFEQFGMEPTWFPVVDILTSDPGGWLVKIK